MFASSCGGSGESGRRARLGQVLSGQDSADRAAQLQSRTAGYSQVGSLNFSLIFSFSAYYLDFYQLFKLGFCVAIRILFVKVNYISLYH